MPTFFTFQGHSGLQVVHLELQTFQGAVGVPGLPLVGNQHSDDDQQKQAATPSDSDNGRKRQQAIRVDVKSPGGVLEPTGTDLKTHTQLSFNENTHRKRKLFLFKQLSEVINMTSVRKQAAVTSPAADGLRIEKVG